ncbi:MAG TPA: TonB family protein [Rhodocyclaceae bacterium]|nr:TonB family protein [Rhodocyclaceae bacterium]
MRAFSAERTAYEDAMVKRLEHLGTLNYPAEARGKIYGSLLLSVTVDRDGHVVDVVVERSSGQKVLDDAARRVVRMGAPYAPLPERVRQQYDQMVIIRTWSFTRGEALETLQ